MQAIILATDETHQLPPLTDSLAAPMLPIVDRPVMATTIEILARFGLKKIIVCVHARENQITTHFGSGRRWGVELKYLFQRAALGSAGSLSYARSLLTETCLVLPGDQLCDLELEQALHFHQNHGGSATTILHGMFSAYNGPYAALEDDGRLRKGAPMQAGLAYTGAFLFEPHVLSNIPVERPTTIIADLLPTLLDQGEAVYGYTMTGYWNPLQSLAAFQQAQIDYLQSAYALQMPEQADKRPTVRLRYPSLEARSIAPGIWVGSDPSIHPSAMLAPPLYLGPQTWVGREVELGPQTILGSNVVIDDEATVHHSTVLSNTYVGCLVAVDHKIVTPDTISDPATEATTMIVDPFLISPVEDPQAQRVVQRGQISRVVAGILITVLSPLILLIGLLALLTNRGRFLLRETYVGGRINPLSDALFTFQRLQFRTRHADGRYVMGGRWMERWELQRLPELFNAWRGDLALVGIKPLRPEELAQLTESWCEQRHAAAAGLTGLWYIDIDPASDLETVVVTDVYYTATRSRGHDLLILLRTPLVWLRRSQQRGLATDQLANTMSNM
ncbi:MAG: nucleotidyl transferase [Candidatus Viridilinea halotolerans]|uniref:Nucleotidyl transferase n=1 Tax=Candidatus Viridilinea halotolerans TaxID=2491704 RepID=A0A426TR77_9CHLR|nr:MAG: nucleotidyl transferase [Candidatus Viridilinea halotolerans]